MKEFLKRFIPGSQTIHLKYKVKPAPRFGHGKPPHSLLKNIIEKNSDGYAGLLNEVLKFEGQYAELDRQLHGSLSGVSIWNNGYLPGLDTMILYTMIATHQPSNYVEIGSGYSTLVASQAINNSDLQTRILCIDPKPRHSVEKVADQIIYEPIEDCDLDEILSLQDGDILFFDGSHMILPNNDCTIFFLEILPFLKSGVVVQIHDIYLPYDYPQFMCDRFYSEQYGLAIYLMSNPSKYRILSPNYYISHDEYLSSIISKLWLNSNLKKAEKHGGSFWFEIV